MKFVEFAVPLAAIVLLASVWGTWAYDPLQGVVVSLLYGFGFAGFLLMYHARKHLRNPNREKAFVCLFGGTVLLVVAWLTLEMLCPK